MHLVHDILSSLKRDVALRYFGPRGEIKLTDQNLVYIDSTLRDTSKVATFGKFKENIHYYSELMDTPCVGLLYAIELQATQNAQRSRLAKSNLHST